MLISYEAAAGRAARPVSRRLEHRSSSNTPVFTVSWELVSARDTVGEPPLPAERRHRTRATLGGRRKKINYVYTDYRLRVQTAGDGPASRLRHNRPRASFCRQLLARRWAGCRFGGGGTGAEIQQTERTARQIYGPTKSRGRDERPLSPAVGRQRPRTIGPSPGHGR